MLGPLLKIAAAVVDHPLARILLGLFGILVTSLFGLFAVALLLVDPLETPGSFAFGLAACLGLIGWWARLFVRSAFLVHRPRIKVAISVFLLGGIGAASYGLAIIPWATAWFPLLASMAGAGILMLLGTVGSSGSGPNNSFKPNPLRGSA